MAFFGRAFNVQSCNRVVHDHMLSQVHRIGINNPPGPIDVNSRKEFQPHPAARYHRPDQAHRGVATHGATQTNSILSGASLMREAAIKCNVLHQYRYKYQLEKKPN
jgi:hypothetical protein